MFVEEGGGWEPLPWKPPSRRRLTDREERVIMWLIPFCVLLLLVAPIGGATVVQAVIALFGGH